MNSQSEWEDTGVAQWSESRAANQGRVGRTQILRAIRGMRADEVAQCLYGVSAVLTAGKYAADEPPIMSALRDPARSHAAKLVDLFVHRTVRLWRRSHIEGSVAAHRDLAWLRASLFKEAATTASLPGQRAVNTPVAEPPGHAPVTRVTTIRDSIGLVYQICVKRQPGDAEIAIWENNFANGLTFPEFLALMHSSPEAEGLRRVSTLLPDMVDGAFVQHVYEVVHGRGCTPWEISHWQRRLTAGELTRTEMLAALFAEAVAQSAGSSTTGHDAHSCHIMGTGKKASKDDWDVRRAALATERAAGTKAAPAHSQTLFEIKRPPGPLVTAIASLYRGEEFIEQFMDNITSQSCFRDHCELVIIDADSPENEAAVIERFCKQHGNIVYRRMNYRIGIYEAWNAGAKLARGEYLTNTNLDDLRRHDSLAIQAATLDALDFVDVVYQDFYYSFDPGLTFEEVARFGYKSDLPEVTPYNMMHFNSPHNAPMWRKRLHDEMGYFDTTYRSAGDYEFWMRCLVAGKNFFKINEPHVVYYQNPAGISTRPDTRGVQESRRILRTYARQLVSPNVVMPEGKFTEEVLGLASGFVPATGDRYAMAQLALRALAIRERAAAQTAASGAEP
ncbi:MAG: glycosyltransferase [Betaproteobacteria bacterium]|nr:glycosyltransferase [Betaproteobacteria bacterium]